MRVLIVDLERLWRGGQEQALLLSTGLERSGHRAELVAVRDSAIAERALAAGIRVHAVADRARRIGAALRIRKLLQQSRFEVVFANEAHALTAAWLARSHRQAPLIAARRVVFPLSHGSISLARYRAAAKVVAISEAVRLQLLAAGLDEKRIDVIPDGVKIPECITPEIRQRARKRWGFRADEAVLVNVGALSAEKGHRLLIDAFAKLRQRFANCRLLIAGDGPLRAELERKARAAGLESSVIFSGFVAEIDPVYTAADLFVFPSLEEGAGTSLLRAMAFGLPVLALGRGGVTEIIKDGINGILVREASSEALAWAAAGMLGERELRQQLGQAARETIVSRYSADRMIEDTTRLFERLK